MPNRKKSIHLFLPLLLLFALGCNSSKKAEVKEITIPEPTGLDGKILAQTHCGGCHLFPEPALLPKHVWEKSVLPEMGYRLGIGGYLKKMTSFSAEELSAVMQSGIYPEQPLLAEEDWQKIVTYYVENSPEELENLTSLATEKLDEFTINEQLTTENRIVNTQYNAHKNEIFVGNSGGESKVIHVKNKPELTSAGESKSPVVSRKYHKKYGEVRLEIGVVDPSNLPKGRLMAGNKVLINELHRPVDMVLGDINEDGAEDFIIANFGYLTGNLSWYDGKTFAQNVLINEAGTRVIYHLDFDKDGKKDIIVLLSQGNEQIIFFRNTGKSTFEMNTLLRFSPVNGSSYVDVVDFDKDGDYDLVYTNGDNADYSPVRKPYHGVHIFKNDGKNNFSETYFYPINGASKVVVDDFDGDGDNDMGVISFYPVKAKNEGFLFFEQETDMKFTVKTKKGISDEKWLTLDYGDFDQDGDLDFVLGSYQQSTEKPPAVGSLVILKNTKK